MVHNIHPSTLKNVPPLEVYKALFQISWSLLSYFEDSLNFFLEWLMLVVNGELSVMKLTVLTDLELEEER